MASISVTAKPPLDLNSPEFEGLRQYFGKESIQRHLRSLMRESVYTVQELKVQEMAPGRNEDEETDKEERFFSHRSKHRFGGNKQIQDVYLQEDKRRRMRELLAQAKIFREIDEKKREENYKKQALEVRLKKEMVDKVRDFHRRCRNLNSLRFYQADPTKNDENTSVLNSARETKTALSASKTSLRGGGSKSARTMQRYPQSSLAQSLKLNLHEGAGENMFSSNRPLPQPGNNISAINYTDRSGLIVPWFVDVDDIDQDYLEEALTYRELAGHRDFNAYPYSEVASTPRKKFHSNQETPRSAATTMRTNRTAKSGVSLNGDYFAAISAPAVRNINRNFERSAKSKFTPRDFQDLQNTYGIKLRPIETAKVVSSLTPKAPKFQKIKFTREKIRYPPHPPKFYMKENLNSNVKLTLRYNGVPTKVVAIPEEGHKIQITHQPGSGTNYLIFSGYVHPGNALDIVSKRLPGHPFSITIFIQGYADTRVSTCCEFRHQEGFKIGGRLGRFTVEKITGDPSLKCYKCKLHDYEMMPKLRKLIVQDKFKQGKATEGPAQVEEDAEYEDDYASDDGASVSSYNSVPPGKDQEESAVAASKDEPGLDSFNETSRTTADKGGALSETFSDSETRSEMNENRNSTSITYKVTLVATNLELARDCTVVLKLFGDKKKQLLFELENPFRKVLKMNVSQSFIGTRIGKVSRLEVTSDSGEYANWFLKDVIIEYGSYKTSFKCERWIGLSDNGKEMFTECSTVSIRHLQSIRSDALEMPPELEKE